MLFKVLKKVSLNKLRALTLNRKEKELGSYKDNTKKEDFRIALGR